MLIFLLGSCVRPEPGPVDATPPETGSPEDTDVAPDTSGDTGRDTDTDTGTPPEEPTSDFLFADGVVTELRLELDPEALASLAEFPEEWVQGALVHGEDRYAPIGVRLKGNGSFLPIDQKPSFKLNFDEYQEDLRFYGLERLVLNNMSNDATQVHERVAHRLYREAGVPDVRAGHGWVLVNGAPYGLYSVVDNIDGDFLERWYEEPDGSMWEMFDVDFLLSDIPRFEHETGPDDRTVLDAIAAVLDVAEPGDWAALAPYVDGENFLRYFAVSAVIGQYDAYPYSFPGDDIHVYLDPSDNRLDFIPHGTDEAFEDPERPIDYLYGRLAAACLADPLCVEQWTAEVWSVQTLSETIDLAGYAHQVIDEITPFTEQDERRPFTDRQVRIGTELLFEFLATRPERLAYTLGERPTP